jgi:hypothetical protein
LLSKSRICVEYVYCYLLESICLFENEARLSVIAERLEESSSMIRSIEISSSKSKLIPYEILKSYRYYLKGIFLKKQCNYLESYETLILALDG